MNLRYSLLSCEITYFVLWLALNDFDLYTLNWHPVYISNTLVEMILYFYFSIIRFCQNSVLLSICNVWTCSIIRQLESDGQGARTTDLRPRRILFYVYDCRILINLKIRISTYAFSVGHTFYVGVKIIFQKIIPYQC